MTRTHMQAVIPAVVGTALALCASGVFASSKDVRVINGASEAVPVTLNPSGSPVPTAPPVRTHLGVPPQDLILLNTGGGTPTVPFCGSDASVFYRAPGSSVSSHFVVPAGKALVITDVQYGLRAKPGAAWSVGDMVSLEFRAHDASLRVWQSGVIVDAPVEAAQRLWRNEQILGGVLIPPEKTICFKAGFGFEPEGEVSFINLTMLRGYLIDY